MWLIPEIADPDERRSMKGFIHNIEQVTALYGGLNAGRPTSIVFQLRMISLPARLTPNQYLLYESAKGTFRRELTVDESGFVLDYPGLWMAEARAGEETHE
jgi:hypothetical protein